jgi:hypothetical protein
MRKEVRHDQLSYKGKASERADTSARSRGDYCEYGFVLGVQGTNDCKAGTNSSLIVDKLMCIKAAQDAQVTAPQDNFVIPQDWETVKPQGCFHDVCAEDPTKGCFFYNPIGYNTSKNLESNPTPVCSRAKYQFAKEGSTGEEADCPDGFKPITTLPACEAAGRCEDVPPASQVRPWENGHNEALTLNYPKYCSFGSDDLTVFNEENDYWQSGTFQPAGTPICIEKTPITIE